MAHILESASSLDLFGECQRKWAYRYLEKLETTTHPSALLGTDTHDNQLGPFFLTGRAPDFTRESGYIAATMLPLLPAVAPAGAKIERHFVIPSPGGKWGYQGYVDLYLPDSRAIPNLVTDTPAPAVVDFKTTSDFRWVKSARDLETNIQAQLYAMAIMFEENVDAVDLVWTYGRTRKPYRAQRTHLRVLAPHVAEQFGRIEEIAARSTAIRLANPPARDLPPNALVCDKYGGCPYRDKCNLSPAVVSEAINMSSILGKLRNTTPEPAPAPVVPEQPKATADLMKDLNARSVPPLLSDRDVPAPTEIPAVFLAPINPPESALPPAPPVGVVAPAEEKPKRGRPKKAASETAAPPSDMLSPEDSAAVLYAMSADTVTYVYGEEVFTPSPYNTCKVGPFTLTTQLRQGETVTAAMARLAHDAHAFAGAERSRKLNAFKLAVGS